VKVAIEEMTNVKGSLIRRLFPDKAFIAQVHTFKSVCLFLANAFISQF
jgi:hypothetical protein